MLACGNLYRTVFRKGSANGIGANTLFSHQCPGYQILPRGFIQCFDITFNFENAPGFIGKYNDEARSFQEVVQRFNDRGSDFEQFGIFFQKPFYLRFG